MKDYLKTPKIQRGDIKLLWHSDYWDGIISGMLLYRNRQYWFEMFEENKGEDFYRRFFVFKLTGEQIIEETNWQQLFREKVGGHTDYDENGMLNTALVKPSETHAEFYDAYKNRKKLDLSGNEIIGWFEI
ncbi:MAG TPA: hypothetical protein VF721_06585 [Pyrinomonadaceae bacterium]|jgi:hypothetical protein